jgi:hypothetical protein
MCFFSFREIGARCHKFWRTLIAEKEVVPASHGKPIAFIASIGESTFEGPFRTLHRQRGKDALARLRAQAEASGASKMTEAEIHAEISAARREKAAKSPKRLSRLNLFP